jgi:hypothetical protein
MTKPAEKTIRFVKPKPGEQLDFTHHMMNQNPPKVMEAIEWAEFMGTNTIQVSEKGMPCPVSLGLSVGSKESCKTTCPTCRCLPGHRIVRVYLEEGPGK